ncbi:MAG: PIG-L family deacetylase [Oscillospiraceae bacterium]|nr:PIG-L family deacetylase [Oscillospiraceae bacterium]
MPTLSDIIQTYGAIPQLASFKRPMFIGPHPDDIEFCCGALVSKMVQAGIPVTFLIATDGAAGTNDPSVTPQMMRDIREKESLAAAASLGVANVEFCRLEDGGPYSVEEAMRAIAPYVLKYQPDILFGPDPKLKTECHADHLKIGEAVRRTTKMVPYPESVRRYGISTDGIDTFPSDITLAFYATDDANTLEAIEPSHLEAKIRSLYLHTSQMQDDSVDLLLNYFKLKAMELGKNVPTGLAEDYQVIVPICQHVYSEGIHY